MGRISKWLGIDDLRKEVEYLRGIIEEDYCLIIAGEGQKVEGCNFKMPEGKTAILLRGNNATITGCIVQGTEKRTKKEEDKDQWVVVV